MNTLLLICLLAAAPEVNQRASLQKTITQLETENAALVKESQDIRRIQDEKLNAIDTRVKQIEADTKAPIESKFASELNAYNARCGRTFNRETEMADYNQCVADKTRIEAERTRIQKWWKEFSEDWDAKNVAPVNAFILKGNERLKAIREQFDSNQAKLNSARTLIKSFPESKS